ncbi:unnamed protein product, partial [Polarella glacialis]
VEETINRIKTHKGVSGIVIVSPEGVPIRSTLDSKQSLQYSALISQLAAKARSVVRDLDPQNDLTFLRIRSKKQEIMVAPDRDYMLIVIQACGEEVEIESAATYARGVCVPVSDSAARSTQSQGLTMRC